MQQLKQTSKSYRILLLLNLCVKVRLALVTVLHYEMIAMIGWSYCRRYRSKSRSLGGVLSITPPADI